MKSKILISNHKNTINRKKSVGDILKRHKSSNNLFGSSLKKRYKKTVLIKQREKSIINTRKIRISTSKRKLIQ